MAIYYRKFEDVRTVFVGRRHILSSVRTVYSRRLYSLGNSEVDCR